MSSQLGEAFVPIRATLDKLDQDLAQTRGKMEGVLGGIASKMQTLGKVATGAIVGGFVLAGAAVGKFAIDGIGAARDMEAQMSNIAAVLGATTEEIKPLNDLILDLGLNPNLKVTAVEAAEAIEMLAKNGLTMTEVLNGAAESTVLLANSTGAEFGQAANIATDVMSVFGIKAADMMDAVNGITAVTVNSKFTIDDFALALAQGGGVASAAGVSFEDFNTTIAAISPLFASGSDAGTSLKTMLLRLVPATDKAQEAMVELGLYGLDTQKTMGILRDYGIEPASDSMLDLSNGLQELSDKFGTFTVDEIIEQEGLLQNAFYDTEGNMKDMAEIAGVLQDAFGGLSEAEKTAAMQTIFGTDAMRAAVALADTGEEAFLGLADSMSQTDALQSAATRMDNLAGATEILQGIFETISLQVGQALLPFVRQLVDWAAQMADRYGPAVVAIFTLFSETLAGFIANLEEGMSPLNAFIEAIWDIAPQGVLDALTNLRDNILPGLIAWFDESIQPIMDTIAGFVEWQDVLIGLAIAIGSVVIPIIWGILSPILAVIAVGAALVAAIAIVRTAWENDWGGIRTFLVDAWNNHIMPAFEALRAWVIDVLIPTVTTLYQQWQEKWDTITTVLQNAWTVISAIWTEVGRWINDNLVPWIEFFKDKWQENFEIAQGILENVWAAMLIIFEPLRMWLAETIPGVVAALKAAWEANILPMSGPINTVLDAVQRFKNAAKSLYDWLKNKVFSFQINLPNLPDWAVPGSPLPIHTAWADFAADIGRIKIAPEFNLPGMDGMMPALAGATSSPAGGGLIIQVDARNSSDPREVERRVESAVDRALKRAGRDADRRIRT